jgi:hypothetical protein
VTTHYYAPPTSVDDGDSRSQAVYDDRPITYAPYDD